MKRTVRSFESIPSFSTIFWNIPFYKNNVLENNKQVSLNYGKYNNSSELGFMCNTRFKQHITKNNISIHSSLNMVGNLNSYRFKVYEYCYFHTNSINSEYIQLDYSLLWLDITTNEPFYSPLSQEMGSKLRDKICISLSLKNDVCPQTNSSQDDNYWGLLSNKTQSNLHIIKNVLIENRDKCITTD